MGGHDISILEAMLLVFIKFQREGKTNISLTQANEKVKGWGKDIETKN